MRVLQTRPPTGVDDTVEVVAAVLQRVVSAELRLEGNLTPVP